MLYIHFFHGRKTIEEEMNDWGQDGPILEAGFISWTYGRLKLHDLTDDFIFLAQTGELIPIADMYYGDFEILHPEDPWLSGKPILSLSEFKNLNKIIYHEK